MIQLGRVLGGMGNIPTTFIQLAGAGSIIQLAWAGSIIYTGSFRKNVKSNVFIAET